MGLTPEEQRTVGECLEAAARGPFFPDWEFRTLFGVERVDVTRAAEEWPDVDESSETVFRSINNSMVYLLFYPHKGWGVWDRYVSVPPSEVERVFQKWRGIRLEGAAVDKCFDGML